MYKSQQCTLQDFIRIYALRISTKNHLQYGLLICDGMPHDQAVNLVFGGDDDLAENAVNEMVKLGFMRRVLSA